MCNKRESMSVDERELAVQVQKRLSEGMSAEAVAQELEITVEEVDSYGGVVRALTRAIDECIEEGILKDFLSGNRADVLQTLLFECREFQEGQM